MGKEEGVIQRHILRHVSQLVPQVKIWRANSGKVKVKGGYMSLAPAGTADIVGLIKPHGQFLAIEVKVPGQNLSEAQEAWRKEIESMGGLYIIATDWRQCAQDIKRYVDEMNRKDKEDGSAAKKGSPPKKNGIRQKG